MQRKQSVKKGETVVESSDDGDACEVEWQGTLNNDHVEGVARPDTMHVKWDRVSGEVGCGQGRTSCRPTSASTCRSKQRGDQEQASGVVELEENESGTVDRGSSESACQMPAQRRARGRWPMRGDHSCEWP